MTTDDVEVDAACCPTHQGRVRCRCWARPSARISAGPWADGDSDALGVPDQDYRVTYRQLWPRRRIAPGVVSRGVQRGDLVGSGRRIDSSGRPPASNCSHRRNPREHQPGNTANGMGVCARTVRCFLPDPGAAFPSGRLCADGRRGARTAPGAARSVVRQDHRDALLATVAQPPRQHSRRSNPRRSSMIPSTFSSKTPN